MRGALVPAALRYVDQVARSGSIQSAAREMNIAASAINRQILLLERDLGVTLFERVTGGMRLTPAGDALVALTRRWRSDERRAKAELKQLQGVNQGHVRLVAMDSHVNGFLPRFVSELNERHPRISLEIQIAGTDEAQAALLSGAADLIAAFNLNPHREIHVLWRRELPFGCVVAPNHPLARRKTTSMQEVAGYPFVLQNKALAIRRYLEARHGWLLSEKTIETNSLQLVKRLAGSGNYVAFTSELDAAPELVSGALVFVPVRDKGADPQTVSVAIDARKPFAKIARIVADGLAAGMDADLQDARRRIS
ncbi:LysR family transcriptional regulator [Bradyrhizobium iriomotense]|uniref:Transcriptional regulator n=1 Tax=Bradyrhizobium iriomotense TaxID=441950 RepID=A0ABQ6BCS9_9BRAD|nr:LysR family transcriptional regulator [Bradyrhizobium iriomotense]GLR89942.1 transcriptional regulator [Bradyrhizobium iriomotense]